MARFPKIESACPLPDEQQRCIAGFCGQCGKSVQRLDDMDEAQRAAWMKQAAGPVCVSYRLPRPALAGLAVAALLAAAPAVAGSPDAEQGQGDTVATVADAPDEANPLLMLVMVGGISEPGNAEWIDDSGLPDLPQRHVEGSFEARAEGTTRPAAPAPSEDTGA
ncbi:hypothetical protein [uncultured Pseudoxanthomonas sp.]|uniref:hypothetical protein n=1 Tax=uncultured Pseudoxanthomonas sp. TaxID=281701 RepID=UPI00260E5B2B|nr:hypothetical protein [uncultured Pseudoxanthomonas sp.]